MYGELPEVIKSLSFLKFEDAIQVLDFGFHGLYT